MELNEKMNTYLVTGLLVIAAFVIGMLFTEVRYLKKGTGTAGTGTQQVAQQPSEDNPFGGEVDAASVPPVTEDDYVRGNPDASITLIEYSDLECPFCKNFHDTMLQVMEEYDGQVRWVYRHYPLSFHANAEPAAEAAECVGSQAGNDAYWAFLDLYFATTDGSGTGVAVEDMPALAAQIDGVNAQAVETCMENDEFLAKIEEQMASGAAAGVSGTPGTILLTNDGQAELISGALPFAQVQQIIEKYVQ